MGKKKWRMHVAKVATSLRAALAADYVVLGGGNCKKLKKLPPGARLGNNENAFLGGFRMWEESGDTRGTGQTMRRAAGKRKTRV
jgi:hypothetical protein